MKNLAIIGKGGHARVIKSCIDNNCFNLIWNDMATSADDVKDVPALFVIGVGDNWSRKTISEKIESAKPKYATIIHHSAQIADDIVIGEGTVIMPNAVINAGCVIGKHCIVNTGAILEHDSVMEDFSSLAPRVATGGNVYIGECSAIGLGAVINNDIKICSQTVIGSGSIVTKDIQNNVVAYGVPCKVIRKRNEGEKYL